MPAEYAFVSRWEIPCSAERCWGEVERMLRPRADGRAVATWWPQVTVTAPPARLVPGERLTLVVRSPLGYRLRITLTLVDVVAGRTVVARSDGDLAGGGVLTIDAHGADAASVVFRWNVVTTRRWMNASSFVLRPVFERAHAHVMARGRAGLTAALRAGSPRGSEPRNAGNPGPRADGAPPAG